MSEMTSGLVERARIADIIDPEAILANWRDINRSMWMERRRVAEGKADAILAILAARAPLPAPPAKDTTP